MPTKPKHRGLTSFHRLEVGAQGAKGAQGANHRQHDIATAIGLAAPAARAFGLPDIPLSSLRINFPDDQGEPKPIITLSKKHADDGFSGWEITWTTQAVTLSSPAGVKAEGVGDDCRC